jgi:hypothetical protein
MVDPLKLVYPWNIIVIKLDSNFLRFIMSLTFSTKAVWTCFISLIFNYDVM